MDNNLRMKMQYIGVCCLLARIASQLPRDSNDRPCIEAALTDAAQMLDFEYHVNGRGYLFQPKEEK